ncbi:RRP15-like protein [Anopheles ziemanni]|uniref:RRP15-like protein n=1 Tax=Anopheles coustani TaxID=139045 RepID=UPI0026591021|nr:RRP15-like protein [Anopheles coustani]XP_058169239.1 RRP15-like protein [Anopheles ziemanni]
MMKVAKKVKATPLPAQESDSDSLSEDSSADEEFLSDGEYPMSEDESAGENNEESDDESKNMDESGEPTKWAKTMAKFLRKTTDAKILSKATSEAEIERKKKESSTYKFEVVGQERTVKKETSAKGQEDKPDDLQLAYELLRQKALLKKERRKDILGLRVRPTINDYERERTLRKVATKGTVQLFNAVRKQQKEVNRKLDEAGKLEYKREKVLKTLSKKEFLDALMNGPRAKSELVDNLVKKEEDEDVKSEVDSDEEPKSTWGPLRADFLTGKKSGWDKEYAEDERNVPDGLDDNMQSDSD